MFDSKPGIQLISKQQVKNVEFNIPKIEKKNFHKNLNLFSYEKDHNRKHIHYLLLTKKTYEQIGYISLNIKKNPNVIEKIYVNINYRKQGIGRKLYKYVFNKHKIIRSHHILSTNGSLKFWTQHIPKIADVYLISKNKKYSIKEIDINKVDFNTINCFEGHLKRGKK